MDPDQTFHFDVNSDPDPSPSSTHIDKKYTFIHSFSKLNWFKHEGEEGDRAEAKRTYIQHRMQAKNLKRPEGSVVDRHRIHEILVRIRLSI